MQVVLTDILLLGFVLSGCTRVELRDGVVDGLMLSAYRPSTTKTSVVHSKSGERYHLLAGDFHCHISPPDHPRHVSRKLKETVELAQREGLDFVVLTPHIGGRFFSSDSARQRAVTWQRRVQKEVDKLDTSTLFIPGFEYTDHQYGHVGFAFGDMDQTFSKLSARTARAKPERFFADYVAAGGLLVIHHPLLTPLDSWIPNARWNLSWRPLFSAGPFSPEIAFVDRHAQAYEAFNLVVLLRDRFL